MVRERWWAVAIAGCSSALVLLTMTAGRLFPGHEFSRRAVLYESPEAAYPWIRWDAEHYHYLATVGYDPIATGRLWNVAFFPGYPCLVWMVHEVTRLPTGWAMAVVANALFVSAMALSVDYLRFLPWMTEVDRRRFVVLYCFWPASLFFRAGYSESLFLLGCIGFLMSLRSEQRWSIWAAAFWAGVAGSARVVGVALPAALLVHVLVRRRDVAWTRRVICLVASCWGFVAACACQYVATGDALAFLHIRDEWAMRTSGSWWERVVSLMSFEPVWRPSWFLESSVANNTYAASCWFCRYAWLNPLVALACPVLLLIAEWKRLVRGEELWLAALLWGIPFFAHAYDNLLLSHARYDLFVFPAYLVIVSALRNCPAWLWYSVVGVLAAGLLFFSYGFGSGCSIF